MSSRELQARLSSIKLFEPLEAGLRRTACDILVDISEQSTLQPGEILYEKGNEDRNQGAFLLSGGLTVQLADHHLEIEAPDLVGEMLQFNEFGQRTATVVASSEAEVLGFSWHNFVERIKQHPEITSQRRAALRNALKNCAGQRLEELSGQE